jgi:predicted protein tyrosine phosphatase
MTALSRSSTFDATARTADQVDEHVFIGGYLAAADRDYVKRNGITRIVKLFADDPSYPGGATRLPGVTYLVIDALDEPDYNISKAAAKALPFIREAIKNNERILVHCHMGVSRSATVVLFYMLVLKQYVLPIALGTLRNIRPWINPNPGFMRHLGATDIRLKSLRSRGKHPYAPPPLESAMVSWKPSNKEYVHDEGV